jgi:glycosyltransferase involved in cell wall biosynthesis
VNPQKPSSFRDRAYRGAAATVAVSAAAAAEMRRQQSYLEPQVIGDASAALDVDTDHVRRLRARFDGRPLIGHVGALDDATKGQRTLFEVAFQAAADGLDWQFLLVGDGKDREAFERETAELDNVHFEGFVDNVGDYLAAFDVFVFPSVQEAVGSTLLDAMQAGLPIVASRTGGIPEIIHDGRNGVLIEPRDANGFYAAVDVLLEDTTERVRLRANNLADAEMHTAARMAKAYEAIYRDILSKA